ncbi:hypothetical protein Tco_0847518, partial [Tanacetum coccineum]
MTTLADKAIHSGKDLADNVVIKHTIAPEKLKVDVEPIAPKLLNNRTTHSDYLRHTQEQAAILRKVVEQGKSQNALNNSLDSACKYTKRIQELLIIIRQTCPSINNSSDKLVAVTPKIKDKRVRFTEPVTSSGNTNIKTASLLGLKAFLMLFGITTVLIDVNVAQSKLVLLENFNENYSKCLRLLLKFNSIKDSKLLLEAIENRFGRNEATKMTQRNLLKQQYEKFTALSSKMLDQTFDRLQKFVSQLELFGEKLSQEDVNQKLLRSLSPEWNTHAVVQPNSPQLAHEDLQQIHLDDIEEMDLRCSKKLRQQEGKLKKECACGNITSIALVSCDGLGGYDWSDHAEEVPNYALMAYSFSSSDLE